MTNELRLAVGLSVAAATICSGTLPAELPRFALTREEIAAAIAWGRTARPEGYPLRNSNGERAGALYTPYLRVALAARSAAERNQPVSPNGVTPRVIDPKGVEPSGQAIVYIAMRVDGTRSPDDYEPGLVVRLLHDGAGGAAASPIATSDSTTVGRGKRFAPAYLQYGLERDAVYMFASFPDEQVRRASQVELFDGIHRTRWRNGAHAIITEAELSRWR
jgi:hypothetical protein